MAESERPPLRIGVVGCGRIAQVAHLPAIEKLESLELVGVCDASASLATGVGERYRVASFSGIDRVLELEPDAVVVATPDRLHAEHASAALESDCHVLVEKPLAPSAREARALGELAASRHLTLQVGAMKRHDPGVDFAHSAVGQIGTLLSVSSWYRVMSALRPPTEAALFPHLVVDQDVRAHEATFKADRQRYLLMTHGVHVFDSLRYLAGDLESVSVLARAHGADHAWHGRGELSEGGGLASFDIVANVHSDWAEGFDLYGEHGSLKVRSWFPFYRKASSVRLYLEETGAETIPHFGDADPYERQLEAFVEAVRGGLAPNPDASDGAAAVRMVEAAGESAAAKGARVAL